jgi:putative hydrolase of the HAD superfamily
VELRAIAFDIDGTLYSNLGLYLRNLGFAFHHYTMLRHFAKVRYDLHLDSIDPKAREAMPRDLAGFRSRQAGMLAERSGKTLGEVSDWAEKVMYGELELSFAHVRPYPGVLPALERLSTAGFRLAALSDFPAPRKLEILGLGDRFEVALSSEETGFLKPAPEPFLEMAKRLGLEAGEIFYVGNSPSLDIAGAKGAGMGAALRGRTGPSGRFSEPYAPRAAQAGVNGGPDLVFTDWAVLVDHILRTRDASLRT